MKWKVHQMEVKTYFLNGEIKKAVYVEKPLGFKTHDRENHVRRLKKYLYGLKHAPIAWYGRIDSFMMNLGFTKRSSDHNL
jgi:adenylylsulfate kinase-like enzyme